MKISSNVLAGGVMIGAGAAGLFSTRYINHENHETIKKVTKYLSILFVLIGISVAIGKDPHPRIFNVTAQLT